MVDTQPGSIAQTFGNFGAAGAGALVAAQSSVPGAVTGGALLGAALAPFAAAVAARVGAEWSRKAEGVLDDARGRANVSEADFLDRLAADPRLSALAARVLEAVKVSSSGPKLRALSMVLAEQVSGSGPHSIDDAELIADALARIEQPHVIVLRALPGKALSSDDADAMGVPTLESRTQLSALVVEAAVGGLVTCGLATAYTAPGSSVYGRSEFGEAVLELFGAVGTDAGPGGADRRASGPG